MLYINILCYMLNICKIYLQMYYVYRQTRVTSSIVEIKKSDSITTLRFIMMHHCKVLGFNNFSLNIRQLFIRLL